MFRFENGVIFNGSKTVMVFPMLSAEFENGVIFNGSKTWLNRWSYVNI